MSSSSIPEKTRVRLWVRASGRCQYAGCNKPLWRDDLTMADMNSAYIAHIIADSPDGPRGDNALSKKLAKEISNLMLLCDVHHRLVDHEDVEGHPAERLHGMKVQHERRIELLTSIQENRKSHVILYGANVGDHHAPVSFQKAAPAMLPGRYPAETIAIRLGMGDSPFTDCEDGTWLLERESLHRQFEERVRPRLANRDGEHFSIFAFAPQPLLMELGRLLSDIPAADVFQLHREPPTWEWQDHPEGFEYPVCEPETRHACVALNLSLSATITEARIAAALGCNHSTWTMTIAEPNNDFLKSREQLRMFRECFRRLLNRIKTEHGEAAVIHLFPAVPVAVAVEIGRVWMPKADLPMRVYDQNRKRGGFVHAFDIGYVP